MERGSDVFVCVCVYVDIGVDWIVFILFGIMTILHAGIHCVHDSTYQNRSK